MASVSFVSAVSFVSTAKVEAFQAHCNPLGLIKYAFDPPPRSLSQSKSTSTLSPRAVCSRSSPANMGGKRRVR